MNTPKPRRKKSSGVCAKSTVFQGERYIFSTEGRRAFQKKREEGGSRFAQIASRGKQFVRQLYGKCILAKTFQKASSKKKKGGFPLAHGEREEGITEQEGGKERSGVRRGSGNDVRQSRRHAARCRKRHLYKGKGNPNCEEGEEMFLLFRGEKTKRKALLSEEGNKLNYMETPNYYLREKS